MEENETVPPDHAPETVGDKLRLAREAAGLSREDVAAHTRIAERHLVAIEENRLSDLAGRTYAVGFSRAYARAVGLDEADVAEAVRNRLDNDEDAIPRVQLETFEPGDPARVPSARLAWSAAALGVLAIVLLLYIFWPSFLSPQGSLPDLLHEEENTQPKATAPAVNTPASGTVMFTATEPRVWIKIYDGSGNQLFQKEMSKGESYTLPSDAEGPMLWTARPDAIEITVDGKSVARISERPETVKDVPVSAAALLSRGDGQASAASPAPARGASMPVQQATASPNPAPRAAATSAAVSQPATARRAEPNTSPAATTGTRNATPANARPAARPAAATAAPTPASTPAADPAPARPSESVSTVSAPDSTVSE